MRSLLESVRRDVGSRPWEASWLGRDDPERPCSCTVTTEDGTLAVDAAACDGALASASGCRETVVNALVDRSVDGIVVRSRGLEFRCGDAGVELLSAAGRFVDLLDDADSRLAALASADPLAAAEEAATRADLVADVAAESGLAAAADAVDGYDDALAPAVGFAVGHFVVDRSIPDGARLRDVAALETGSQVRIYDREDGVALYALDPVELSVAPDGRERILDAYELIADGSVDGDRAPSRALERAGDGVADPLLTAVLSKHTRGYGILEDLFADPRVTDVYVTAPVASNPMRVVVDGESMEATVSITPDGAGALASRVRRTSGRAFSRANPTVDATAALEDGTGIRVAGVADPVADGVAFAFRERADDRFTLPALVANGTMSVEVAGFLSVAIERSAATLVAGTRGAGKTTLLGTLLYELAAGTRTVVIEDTPELPVDALQSAGRDVQALRTGTGDGPEISASDALRTALRLGDGALVVGEIRGAEARVLYEAMRVGANANAVLGTIHGDGAAAVYERVVSDLEVPPTSFGSTDLVVTVQAYRTADGRARRLAAIEEVVAGEEVRFEPLFELDGTKAKPTGRIDRGESRLVDRLTGPTESYADVREAIDRRGAQIGELAGDGRTKPAEVAAVYAGRGADR